MSVSGWDWAFQQSNVNGLSLSRAAAVRYIFGRLETALELHDTHLAWRVDLSEASSGCLCEPVDSTWTSKVSKIMAFGPFVLGKTTSFWVFWRSRWTFVDFGFACPVRTRSLRAASSTSPLLRSCPPPQPTSPMTTEEGLGPSRSSRVAG